MTAKPPSPQVQDISPTNNPFKPKERSLIDLSEDLKSSLEDIPSIVEEAQISEISESDTESELDYSTECSTSLGDIYSDASDSDDNL